MIVVGSDGVLIADGQESDDATRAMLAAVATVTDKPVRWMVVGSVHEDHTGGTGALRSEEHTSELQSLMRISYAVFCLKKKKTMNALNNTQFTCKSQTLDSTTNS